ncbi:MAG: FAD-binding oxidoreductase, partial [Pseudomonadota bacterium]|nr:FAD-binding oxidoreductase [Pseudomonadota bacterium]
MTQDALVEQLSAIVGADKVRTDADSLETFGKDWTKIYPPKPSAIVFPKTTQQVADIVKFANAQNV